MPDVSEGADCGFECLKIPDLGRSLNLALFEHGQWLNAQDITNITEAERDQTTKRLYAQVIDTQVAWREAHHLVDECEARKEGRCTRLVIRAIGSPR